MILPDEVIELEKQSTGQNGKPTLARACGLLIKCWDAGERGRELALHLMYLSWYLLIEPPHLTGLNNVDPMSKRLISTFNEVHDYFEMNISGDAEMLYVVGLMAHLSPWLLGDLQIWERRAKQYQLLYRKLAPKGLNPDIFDNRGSYGEYFGGQVRVANGY